MDHMIVWNAAQMQVGKDKAKAETVSTMKSSKPNKDLSSSYMRDLNSSFISDAVSVNSEFERKFLAAQQGNEYELNLEYTLENLHIIDKKIRCVEFAPDIFEHLR